MFHAFTQKILEENRQVLSRVDPEQVHCFVKEIASAKKIVACGAGRMGMMAKAFTMRLSHLHLEAYHIQDCNTPRIGESDLLIVCSGSGETKTILSLVETAKKHGARIGLITSREASSMATLSDMKVLLPAPSKVENSFCVSTIQPMTTLTEQSCLLFFDALVLVLMEHLSKTHDMLKERHSILE